MAGKTYTQKIEFKGHFDGKQVLDELKKIRQNMADAGADDNLFKGIDKDIATTEKLVTEMMAQIQKGFSNTKEVNAFEKQIDKLQTNLLKISSGMQNVNIAENLGLNSPEITSLTKELEQLTAAQDHLKEVSKEALDQAKRSIGLRDDEIAKIKEAVDANEDLEEALKKVGKAREKRFLSQAGEAGMQTQAGKDYIKNANAGISLSDLGAKASSGNTAKAKNDARKRYDDGELYGDANNRQLDEVKAAAAVTEAYQKTLEKMITSGGNAAEAVEEMKKALADYGVEIENTDKLQENFYNDIEGFYKSPAVERGNKGNITKARKIGRTNAQGEYELSDASTQNFLNNSGVTAYADNMRRSAEVTNQLGQEIEEATRRTAELVNENDVGLNNAIQNTNNMTDATKEGAEATREASESVENMNNAFDNMKGAVKTFLSIGSAVSALKNVVRDTFNDIKELDKSFADIAMVTDYSVQEMWNSYDQYAEMANELGQSTQSVIQASGLFYQQGLDTADSLALTEDTMKLATLAGLDFAEATSQMTAALRGFHMEMNEGGRVTDVYSELAAKAAADVEGIAYAMSKTASIASSAGMEFETTSAFLTQMIETTQEAPENIGTAMKTIIARFTELKENVAGTADSEFEDLDYNKVDIALKSVGVSIKDASGQFRDLDDVFLELSQKWNTLDRNSQRYIATIAAGSRQQSRFIAMMENYDRTIELVDTAYDSAGKSSEQFAKYQDTMEYKLNQLQNTWEQFRTRFFNSSFFKSILDGLNSILGKISDFSALDIAGLAGVWILFGKSMIINFVKGVQDSANLLTKAFTSVMEKVKNPINNILKNKLNFKVGANITELNDKINEVEQKYKEAERKIEENDIVIDVDTKNALQKLDQLETEYERLRSEALGAGFTDEEAIDWARSNMSEDDLQNLQRGRTARNALQQRDIGQQELEAQREALDKLREQQESAQKEAEITGQAIGQVLGAAITIGVSAAIASDNPMDAIWTVIKTMIPMMITSIVSMVTAGGAAISAAAIASTAGIMAIVMAITAAITGFAAWVKSNNEEKEAKKAENKVKKLKESIKNLNEEISQTKETMKELSNETDSLEKIQDTYRKLGNKTVKTTEEQEEYNNMIESLKENYPELISFYNEETNQIQINNSLLEEKIKLQKESLDEERRLLSLQMSQNQINNRELKKQQKIANITSENGVFAGTNIDIQSEEDLKQLVQEASSYTKNDLEYTKSISSMDISGYFEIQAITAALDKYNENWIDTIGQDIEYSEIIQMVGEEANLQRALEAGEITGEELAGYREAYGYTEEVIKDFAGAVEEYNTDLANIIKTLNDFDFEGQVAANKEFISQQLGEGYESVSDVLSRKAARIQEEMAAIGNDDEDDFNKKRDIAIARLQASGYDTSGILTTKWEDFIYDATYGIAGHNWKDLDESTKKLAKEMGYDAQTWTEKIDEAKNDEIVTEILEQKYQAYLDSKVNEILSTNIEQADEIQAAFDELYTNMGNMTIDQIRAKATELGEQFILEETDVNSLVNMEGLESALENIKTTGIDGLELLTSSAIQSFSSILDNAQIGENQRKQLGDSINNLLSSYNLTSEQMNQLLQIDLSQGYQQIKSNSETYINALMNTGLKLEEATNTFNAYISSIGTILGKGIYNKEQAEVFKQTLQNDIKGFKEANQPLIDARDEMLENGKLSSETYFKLMEEGFEDYVKVTTNGYELISEKAEEAWTAQVMAPLEDLRDQISIQKDLIAEAEQMQDISSDFSATLVYADRFRLGEAGFSTEKKSLNFDELVEAYAKLKEQGQEAGDILQYFGDKADFVEKMVSQGYTSLEKYIKALQEGKVALSNMEPDTWIQGLVNLQEASVAAEEKTNDLKDELDDLNKQLTDNKKAVDETYKAWQEAIHGTEDYQSSLDGLLNYERRLESFNNKLEDTKKALSDISNINDVKNLLEQTTSLYEGKLGTLKAETKVINQSLENLDKEIMANYANFVSLDEFGNMNVDISTLESADMSDILKDDGFTQLLEKRNEMYDKARETDQAYLDTVKEWEEQYKTARESEIKMEETIINILKEKMQEEVDTVKEKYSALEEADNNYLDALQEAIDKQRKLREQENQYEDLATKQKKLSLMQRDTSGANQKEVQKLEKEVEDDQQNLLDSEIDNLIESMQELYEKQKEARDLEIEAMEAETENMQAINETAMTIMAGFQSVEDYQAWLLENDKTVEDMTATQTEQYLEEAKETFTGYAQYVALTTEDMQLRADEINKQADLVFENTNENVSNIGTTIQELAVAAADKAEEEAKEAYDDAVEKMNETQDKIDETTKKLNDAEDNAVLKHGAAMDAMVEASQSSMSKVSTFATKQLAEMLGYDLSKEEDIEKFAKEFNFMNDKGEITQNLYNAISDSGGEASKYKTASAKYEVFSMSSSGNKTSFGFFDTKEAADAVYNQKIKEGANKDDLYVSDSGNKVVGTFKEEKQKEHGILWPDDKVQYTDSVEEAQQIINRILKSTPSNATDGQYKSWASENKYEIFKTGGLVNYTGPAWVDGTPTKPEAFLNAQDTQRIGEAAKILAQIPALNGASENVSTNIGDTTIEIHINVESIESDYDVDQMIERVKNDIIDVSKPIGTSVILKK